MYDFTIVGGGLAGVTLAYRLIKSGAKVMVIDTPQNNHSSIVAAGIFNPITGKRMALTWNAETIFHELHKFYPKMEDEIGVPFFNPMPFYKLFETVFEQNEWLSKIDETSLSKFVNPQIQFLDSTSIHNPLGAVEIKEAGRLNTIAYIDSIQNWLVSQKALSFQWLDYNKLIVGKDSVSYEKIKSQSFIFCEGPSAIKNPFFNYLPHKPVHGELMEIKLPIELNNFMINKGIYIVPEGKKNHYLVGATYNWDLNEPILTESGAIELTSKLQSVLKCDFEVIKHVAGLRPSTNDRRPYIGIHPKFKNLSLFGGFGSKGVSLIPALSKLFINHLLHDEKLPYEVDIDRLKNKVDYKNHLISY